MKTRDYAEIIKRSLSSKEVAQHLGLSVDRNGFCKCPFHGEKTASLKLYPGRKGWHCFGCGLGGSVIDLVMMYYGLDLVGAIELLNNDFHLGLVIGSKASPEQEAEAKRIRQERAEKEQKRRKRQEEQNDAYIRYLDIGKRLAELEMDKIDYAPKHRNDKFDIRYDYACMMIPQLRDEAADLALIAFGKEDYD